MSEKKVVVVIVEGPSDETALGGILKEYFSAEEVQFQVVHGDITSDFSTQPDNAVKKVDELVENVISRYGYQWTDFAKILHLTDTDGSFTKGCVQQAEVESVLYFENRIETANVEKIERRNFHKAEIMRRLYSTSRIHGVSYRLFFNSCNLEHVLYNELKDFSDDEKERLADDFSDKYEGKYQEFISFVSASEIAVPGNYRNTWRYIEKDKNSLQRHSNMHLIFEERNGGEGVAK